MRLFVIGSYVQGSCWHVAHIPKPGETLVARALNIEPGGKGLNVAVCSKRLGAEVNGLFGIGEDVAGDTLVQLLAQENINATHTHRLAKQSGYATGMIAKNGQNAIAVFAGPNLLLNHSHVNAAKADILQANIVYGQFESAYPAIESCFALAKSDQAQAKNLTVLNPSPWQSVTPSLLQLTDVIIVNEVEVMHLFNDISKSTNLNFCLSEWQQWLLSHTEALFQHWQGELLVVTLGSLGCIAIDNQQNCTVMPTFNIQAVDTICCGDAFASGFCSQYLRLPLVETLRFANACGALTAQQAGMLGSLPNLNQVHAFLAAQKKLAKATPLTSLDKRMHHP